MSELVIGAEGWLQGVEHCHSPNFNARPEQQEPELIVVHGISLPPQQYGGEYIEQLFQNRLQATEHPIFAELEGLKVSAHAVIRRSGRLQQFVSFGQRAWHAGISEWRGRRDCNDFSIGIELEGSDLCAYTSAQYWRLTQLIRALRQHYPSIDEAALCGHSDIAPGRKTDPGAAFEWSRLHSLLNPTLES